MAIFLKNYFGLNERIKSRGFQATQFNVKATQEIQTQLLTQIT
jgi:hypothetical protein